MSQSHPPIPEPQPHPEPQSAPDADEPRTQSILLPPSQRQTGPSEEPAPADPPVTEPAPADPPVAEPRAEWTPVTEPRAEWTPVAEPAPASPEQPLPGQPPTGQFAQPGYAQPAYDQAAPTRATGPLDFVPGFAAERPPAPPTGSSAPPRPSPGPSTTPGTPAVPPPAFPSAGHRRSPLTALRHTGRGSTAPLSLGLGVLGLVLLELGLVLDFGNQSLWDVVPTWSAFATVAALVVLVPAVAGLTGRLPGRTAWRVGAVGLTALAAAWVLVALPLAASDRGFWLTAAVAAAGAALWLAPGRAE
jgi:hypothetical protein